MKPVTLFAYLIGNSTAPSDIVFDSFYGSGTTIIAAEQLKRQSRGLELEPKYVDVCVRRWQTFTGKAAVLIAAADGKPDGRTFDEVFAQRVGVTPDDPKLQVEITVTGSSGSSGSQKSSDLPPSEQTGAPVPPATPRAKKKPAKRGAKRKT